MPMGLARQEYWRGLPVPSPGDLPNPGTEPTSPALAGRFFTYEPSAKPLSQLQKDSISQGFLLHACVLSCVRLVATPWTVIHTRLLCPWDFSGKNAGVSCHFLLQGIFLTQRSNPSLVSPALADRFFTTETPGKPYFIGTPQSKLNKLIFTKHGDNAWHIVGTA